MPLGMWSRHSPNGLPYTAPRRPRPIRWAAVDRPYGPAPTTTTSYSAAAGNALPRSWTAVFPQDPHRAAHEIGGEGAPRNGARLGIHPIDVVVGHRLQKGGAESHGRAQRRRHTGTATLLERFDHRGDVAL